MAPTWAGPGLFTLRFVCVSLPLPFLGINWDYHKKAWTQTMKFLFLVCAFLMKRARLLQWLVIFFRQTTDLIVYVPLFTENDKTTQAKSGQCKLSAKGPPFHFLLFLRNLQNRKRPKSPPFNLFFTVRFFFRKFFNFSTESPLRVFWYFATECVNESQRVPSFHFSALWDIFRKKKVRSLSSNFFVPGREKVIFQSYRAWKAHFGCLETVFKAYHEYVLGLFTKLCAFWALDIAPTLHVPVLYIFKSTSEFWCHTKQFIRP